MTSLGFSRRTHVLHACCGVLASSLITASACGQSSQPALFVVNNSSANSTVSSFRVGADGGVTFVDVAVPTAQLNPLCIDLSPNGRWLCVGHASDAVSPDHLTFLEVNQDAELDIVLQTTTPDTPTDVKWLDDQHVVVTKTSGNPNQLIVYRFNPEVPSITQVWFTSLGASTYDMAISRQHKLLFPRASTSQVWPMTWNDNGVLTKLTTTPVQTGVYYLGAGVSPDGTKLYYGGGISSGGQPESGRWIGGFNVDTGTGALTPMPNSPYLSPPLSGTLGPSPKQVVVSSDGNFAFASHGRSGDVQGFSINQATGELTLIPGSFYDVGTQGQCSAMTVVNNRLYVMRYYSNPSPGDGILAFDINRDGTISLIAPVVPTQGGLPWDIVGWSGPVDTCPADINNSGTVDVSDLLIVIGTWGPCADPSDCPGDINNSGTVDVSDLLAVIGAWGQCPDR